MKTLQHYVRCRKRGDADKQQSRQVQGLFANLIGNLSFSEVSNLRGRGVGTPQLYIYDPLSCTARKPEFMEIDWITEFLLTKYHKKHVFLPGRKPLLPDISIGLRQWRDRLRLRSHFGDSSCNIGLASRGHTAVCHDPCDPLLEDYFNDVTNNIFQHCAMELDKWSHRHRSGSNTPGIVRLGFTLLKRSPFMVLPSDKDGGFVLLLRTLAPTMFKDMLNSNSYRPDSISECEVNNIMRKYFKLCRAIEDTTDIPGLKSALTSDARKFGARGLTSMLNVTIKTHKPAGAVVPRAIHSSVKHTFAPAMRWSRRILNERLCTFSHLVRDSADMVQKLDSISVLPNDKFLKVDIRDYFMSGDQEEIANLSSKLVPDSIRSDWRHIVEFILLNQYVSFQGSSQSWNVHVGSGMELIKSGEISDAAFLSFVKNLWS